MGLIGIRYGKVSIALAVLPEPKAMAYPRLDSARAGSLPLRATVYGSLLRVEHPHSFLLASSASCTTAPHALWTEPWIEVYAYTHRMGIRPVFYDSPRDLPKCGQRDMMWPWMSEISTRSGPNRR